MIFYDEKQHILKLTNGSISYVIYVHASGYLETVYFGRALEHDDYDCIRRGAPQTGAYFDAQKGEEVAYDDSFDVGSTPLELSGHGRGDKRYAPIVIRKADGSYETDFRYVSHLIYEGIPSLKGYPHAHGEKCETVEFLLKDTVSELYVKLFLTIYGDKDVIVKNFEIQNKGEETVHVLRAQSMQLDLRCMDYELVHFCGRLTNERNYAANSLHDGTQEVSSNFGISSHAENPFVYLKSASATMEYGDAIGFNLIYSGNFKFRVDCGQLGSAHITYGLNDEDFEWELQNGDVFVTPQAVISYSDSGIDKMSQNFHRFIKDNLITYRHDSEYKPVLFNSWEGCYFSYDTEAILSYIDDAAAIGTELFVLDDGWFGCRNYDCTSLGDWRVNRQKIDLHRVMTHCRERGIKFGIWFEPEMVSPDSDLYRMHPEYALTGANPREMSLWRHQFCLDFSSPDVVENIYCQMKAFLSEYPVDYIKWDYNRTVAEHFSKSCGHKGRQGEVYHRLTMGYYSLLERLTKEYPDLMIEGCASGGGRFDLGTLYYCPQIWTSDESNPARRMMINYNTSIGYPLSCMGTHVNDSRITDYRSKAIFALFGTYGYEMNPNRLSEREKAQINEIAAIYKQYHSHVIANGTLYHILSPNEGNTMALQCVSEDLHMSLILYANRMQQLERFRFLRLKGLKKDQLYTNTLDNCVHSGEYLMTVGLAFPRRCEEFEYHLICIFAVTEKGSSN